GDRPAHRPRRLPLPALDACRFPAPAEQERGGAGRVRARARARPEGPRAPLHRAAPEGALTDALIHLRARRELRETRAAPGPTSEWRSKRMAVLMIMDSPEATTEQYDRTNEILGIRGDEDAPEGLVQHV